MRAANSISHDEHRCKNPQQQISLTKRFILTCWNHKPWRVGCTRIVLSTTRPYHLAQLSIKCLSRIFVLCVRHSTTPASEPIIVTTSTPPTMLTGGVLEVVYSFSDRHREAISLLRRCSARPKPRPNLRIGDSPQVPKQPSDITHPDAISHVVFSFPIVAEPHHAAFDSSNKFPALMREAFAIPLLARKDASPLAHGRAPVAHHIIDFTGLPFGVDGGVRLVITLVLGVPV